MGLEPTPLLKSDGITVNTSKKSSPPRDYISTCTLVSKEHKLPAANYLDYLDYLLYLTANSGPTPSAPAVRGFVRN